MSFDYSPFNRKYYNTAALRGCGAAGAYMRAYRKKTGRRYPPKGSHQAKVLMAIVRRSRH